MPTHHQCTPQSPRRRRSTRFSPPLSPAVLVASALFGFAALPPARAQAPATAPPPPGTVAPVNPAVASAQAPTTGSADPLTLDEVLRRVETNYPKLLGAEAARQAAVAKRVSKAGAFDPVAVSGTDFLRYNSTSTRGKEVTATTTDAGMEMTTRSGMKFLAGVRLNAGAIKAPDSSSGAGGEWIFGVKMPLARGLGINDKLAAERQAILGIPLAEQDQALTRLDALLNAAASYWDWVAAARRLTVARDLSRVAVVRAAAIRERVRQGDLPGLDAIEADTEVQRRQGNEVKAQRDVEKAALKLGLYLWEGPSEAAPLPTAGQVPAVGTAGEEAPQPLSDDEVQAGVQRALDARPELRSLDLEQRIYAVDRDLARNDQRPTVDLVMQPGYDNGALGIGNTLKTGIAFGLPLGQREARNREREAVLKMEKVRQDATLTQQAVRNQVADAASAVRTTYERFLAAERELALARRLEQGERDRLEAGEGTLFLINQRERATAEAAAKLIDVRAEYEQARAAFRAATVQF